MEITLAGLQDDEPKKFDLGNGFSLEVTRHFIRGMNAGSTYRYKGLGGPRYYVFFRRGPLDKILLSSRYLQDHKVLYFQSKVIIPCAKADDALQIMLHLKEMPLLPKEGLEYANQFKPDGNILVKGR